MTPRLLIAAEVDSVIQHSARVRGFRFTPCHRDTFPSFVPGDHVQLQHQSGVRREYSLIGHPNDPHHYEVAIQREQEGRGGSMAFHDLNPGDTVFVSYPQPGFRIDREASEHVFVAGGIGVTAILGLLTDLPSGSRGVVHYAVRHRDDAILLEHLARFDVELHVHCSSLGERLDIAAMVATAKDATFYACGPERLLTSVDRAAAGRPQGTVRSERFVAAPAVDEHRGDAFTANLLGSKRSIDVGERESLLHALQRADIPVDFSCESGICGSCVIEAANGEVEHRDLCLTEDDRRSGFLATCVSRGIGGIDLLI